MNVIPETCTAHVNFRYGPGRTPREAEKRLQGLTAGLGELEFGGNSPSAPVALDHPLARKLIARRVAHRRAQAGVDAGRRVRRGGLRRGQLRPGRDGAGAPPRRVDPDRQPAVRATGSWRPSARDVRLSPVLAGLGTYPFVRLEEARARLRAAGVEIIDFGMGEPREETPAFIREALAEAITPLAPLPERGRAAGAARGDRRLGGDGASASTLDPDTEVLPTMGSKEAVFGARARLRAAIRS